MQFITSVDKFEVPNSSKLYMLGTNPMVTNTEATSFQMKVGGIGKLLNTLMATQYYKQKVGKRRENGR